MKRFYAFALVLMLVPSIMTARAPRWSSRIPKAENATYRYVAESATATNEKTALNMAMGLVLQGAIRSLGLTVTSTQVENAISTGSVESIVTEFKIPVNKVCTYTEKITGGVRVYVLCQVAVKSDRVQMPQFTEFRNCGSKGGTDEISGRPENWQRFETSSYCASFMEDELEKGQDEIDLQKRLTVEARMNLVANLNMTVATKDESVIALIRTEQIYNKDLKTAYAVAYVSREEVADIYLDKADEEIEHCFRKITDIQSYIKEGNMANAKAILEGIKTRTNEQIEPRLNFLRAFYSTRKAERSLEDLQDLKREIETAGLKLRGETTKVKEGKVQEYVKNAVKCLREKKLADALRYYYGAQVLLKELPNATALAIETGSNGQKENANTYITNSIKDILSKVQITFDGFMPESQTEAKLSFMYEGEAVTNLNFRYNDNNGWSDEMNVMGGWAIIQLPLNNCPSSVMLQMEYRYEADAAFDPELQNLITKNRFNYDVQAKRTVPVNKKVITDLNKPSAGSGRVVAGSKSSTSITQNVVAEKVTERSHLVIDTDSEKYREVIKKVCQLINANDYASLSQYFTLNGSKQMDSLLRYGKARVLANVECQFIKIGDEVMCRSIPMSFSFTKGRKTTENVVFTIDATGKIDGIQFALEERSARNIMAKAEYSETAKLTLVNFMENYKTAFALKRLGYIRSIFADDAVIIVGRVLQSTNNVDINQKKLNENVEYTRYNKEGYMERLANQFKSKEWINIKFSNTAVEKSAQGNMYSIQLLQDYSSNNYGDRGYLFLLIDCTDPDKPLIKVRAWKPESAGATPFTMADYQFIMEGDK